MRKSKKVVRTKKRKYTKRDPVVTVGKLIEILSSHFVPAAPEPQPDMWKTADGRVLRVVDLEGGHLRNAISYLQRRLVHKFGEALYLAPLESMISNMGMLLREANRRGYNI